MNNYRYKLASNKLRKLDCPYCGAKKHWQRYIDIETNEAIPERYGKCDNADKCGEWSDPYKDGYSKAVWKEENNISSDWKPTAQILKPKPQPPKPIYYFDFETFKATLKDYDKNIFIQNLLHNVPFPFPTDEITKIIELYRLGTISNGYRDGAISFPFIDINNNIRTIQVKEFDENNSTKNKGTDFLHSMIERHHKRNGNPPPEWIEDYHKNEMKVSCLFGEHLLKQYPDNPIALVEAPKTAIYGSLYFGSPDNPKNLLWIAVYSKSTFKYDRIKVLQGRKIVVFPDLSKDGNTFDLWNDRAKEFQKRMKSTNFKTFDLLERMGTPEQKNEGLDIADILIKHDWREYRKPQPEPTQEETPELIEEQNTSSIDFSNYYPFDYLPTISLQKFAESVFEAETNESAETMIDKIMIIGNTGKSKALEIYKQFTHH